MPKIERYALLKQLGVTRTRFTTVIVPATAVDKGFALGEGKCKAVVLQINALVYNSATLTSIPNSQKGLYYGDSNQQRLELFAFLTTSEVFICKDLSDIYIKGRGITTEVQVLIYD